MKYLGIDYGTKRIGLARSNEGGTMAFPHGVVVEHGRPKHLRVMIAGLRHNPFCDVHDFL